MGGVICDSLKPRQARFNQEKQATAFRPEASRSEGLHYTTRVRCWLFALGGEIEGMSPLSPEFEGGESISLGMMNIYKNHARRGRPTFRSTFFRSLHWNCGNISASQKF